MTTNYLLSGGRLAGLLLGQWLLAATAWAQAPAWTLATAAPAPLASSASYTTDMVADASGNLLVTGTFTGQVAFGNFTLTSAGGSDFYIAKYLTASNTWAWAQRGGGSGNDASYGVALNGSSVYVAGSIDNDLVNTTSVNLTSTSPGTGSILVPVRGATTTVSTDILVAKYTDAGSSATLGWTQVAGGTANDQAYGLAASGSNVYITGYLHNDLTNRKGVVFGGNGTVAGTAVQAGTSASSTNDIVVAKYTDNGATATFGWSQVGGGSNLDTGFGVAVSGTSVYLTGTCANDKANSFQVVFGGTGTTPGSSSQYGVSTRSGSNDIVVAKYTDNGPTATFGWSQVGGGTESEQAYGIAASGNKVYITGLFSNDRANTSRVLFGGSGTTAGTVQVNGATATGGTDMLVAKYTDNGATATLNWTQVGGGTGYDYGVKVLVNGPNVYVTGVLSNNAANDNEALFGGSGTVAGTASQAGASATTSYDILVVKYTDHGSSSSLDWTQVGGGPQQDIGRVLALGNARLYVGGVVVPAATFGSLSLNAPAGSSAAFLGAFPATVLAAMPSLTATGGTLFPNPAAGAATLSGAPAGAAVGVFDALGRRVTTATADATGTVALPAGLLPGLYVVRAGAATVRWVVE